MKNLQLLVLPLLLAGCACPWTQSHTKAYPQNQPIQRITDKAVSDAKSSLNPKAITVIVAEPRTGKILAMSGWKKDAKSEFRNSNVWGRILLFEPGSTFKPFVIATALDKGAINSKTKIYCEKGLFYYGGKTIKDHYPGGDMTYEEILTKSSNIGAAKISLKLKDEDFYKGVCKFGFGEKTGIAFPVETKGIVYAPSKWDNLTKTRMAFGQSVAVTPLQLTMAYCALANGGKLMKPVIGDEKPVLVRRVCSRGTADRVKNALEKTVSDQGTAPLARVNGVAVGGKTGTAQAITADGHYARDKYWTMFAGFFPVNHPKYVVVVVVDEADLPPEKNYGGLVAAPIFSEIAGEILKIGNK
jgi:cell division protein FtsI/penicillin-binding protein 2